MADGRILFREFLRAPTHIATVTASSDALVAEMIRPFPVREDPVIVELGPGTGRVTDAIQQRLRGRGRHLAIEINPLLAGRLAERHPAVTVVCADAGALPDVLAAHDVAHVDLMSSLLPWAAYKTAPIPRLVAQTLAPDGVFTQAKFVISRWMAPARRQDRETRASFADVRTGATVWRNLPPARVRVARYGNSAG
jgi:phosphatidylethanolamine/phosphatidyl-N-methylethanolamine N-methyltransferase